MQQPTLPSWYQQLATGELTNVLNSHSFLQLGSPQQSSGGQEIRRTGTNLNAGVPLALPTCDATDDGVPKVRPKVDTPTEETQYLPL